VKARLKGRNMALYAVDVRERVIRRVNRRYNRADNERFFLIEAASAEQAWAKAGHAVKPIGAAGCADCRHGYCSMCEGCSLAKGYSDYWICHCCGELNLRIPNLH